MKPIRITRHAETVCRERELDPSWIEQTVRDPEWVEFEPAEPEKSRRFRAIADRGGRYVRVVVVETAEELRIVTAFLDRNARPK